MSALAAILHARGHKISGSDLTQSDQTRMLEGLGVKVFIGHRRANSKHADIVVINGAIREDNPELANNIPVVTREDLLAEIESTFRVRIAVAGSHGKSTTTAMIAQILVEAGLDPTVHNGAVMHIKHPASQAWHPSLASAQAPLMLEGNYLLGKGDIFLTEACEFKRSFLTLSPTIAVITNIDFDHVDCFKDFAAVKQSFDEFAKKAGTVVRTEECPPVDFALQVPGAHNLENARAAAQVGRVLGIKEDVIRKALENFKGTDRRFQRVGVIQTCDIISDYAHHPAELAATIQTARSLYNRFLVIFQPHTYTRTVALFNDFVKVLSACDCVMYRTYAARELPIVGGRAKDLAAAIKNSPLERRGGTRQRDGVVYIATPTALNNFIKRVSHKYDAIVLAGAGDMQGLFKA